jgi:D-alanyl-lipoteichoic acid acyltransferase DltB (MBOAT superfamily)
VSASRAATTSRRSWSPMALNSLTFLVGFLPIVVIITHVLRDRGSVRGAQTFVLLSSLAFYVRDDRRNLLLLLGSITFNWGIARLMGVGRFDSPARKRLLVIGLSGNIAFLGLFKYGNLVVAEVGRVLGHSVSPLHFGFPLGVSFFILTQVMYLVDCYERIVQPSSYFDHATFVSFFPNITAGPLVRAKRFVGQLSQIGSPVDRDDRVASAIALLSMGLFKKVVLGDSFGRIADAGYANASSLSTLGAWATSLSYTFYIYYDFSGYSDMAFGAGRLLGIDLVKNFNAPFRSLTISDFWQRWHISLSQFISTYLHTPLVRAMGGRATVHKAALATIIAMTIVGIWHGAAWGFVLFFVMHGIGLAAYQYWKRRKRPLPKPVAAVVTFAFVNLAFIVFRSPDLPTAVGVARQLLPAGNLLDLAGFPERISSAELTVIGLPLIAGVVLALVGPTSNDVADHLRPSWRAAFGIVGITLVSLLFMSATSGSPFIYRAF